MLIERILLLVRNILHIPADLDQEKVRKGLGYVSFCVWLGWLPFSVLFCFVCLFVRLFVYLLTNLGRGALVKE